jgi:hypothetical protein
MSLHAHNRWMSPRMVAVHTFVALHPSLRYCDLPPLEMGLVKRCATPELLIWLLDSTMAVSCGEKAPLFGDICI